MRQLVAPQQVRRVELQGALFAGEIFDTRVSQQMHLKVAGAGKMSATQLADAVTLAAFTLKCHYLILRQLAPVYAGRVPSVGRKVDRGIEFGGWSARSAWCIWH